MPKAQTRSASKASTTARSSSSRSAAKPRDSKQTAQAAVDKVAKDKGWVVYHAQEPQATSAAGSDGQMTYVTQGHFVASKRVGTTLVEQSGATPEQLADRIEDWERSQPSTEPAPPPSEEALLNSAKATLHLAITAGARPAVDVDLTPAAKKADAKATRLEAKPEIKEVKLDKETQQGISEDRAGLGKTTGLGGGA